MKPETILNALLKYGVLLGLEGRANKRQAEAFRARILRMFAEKERELEEYKTYHAFHMGDMPFIETMHDKDEKIKELIEANETLWKQNALITKKLIEEG